MSPCYSVTRGCYEFIQTNRFFAGQRCPLPWSYHRRRGRGNIRGTAGIRTWRTVLLSTGEAPAVRIARCLEIRGAPLGATSPHTWIPDGGFGHLLAIQKFVYC